ncbi:MAG TPA: nitrous oxide-stimulated promoter family protein [Candidatus Hydrogenedentes bacterium]|nr:nitrous oxide-stimulated promoter family protein [Candidatus Hydrogenedentota bacterium]
MNREFNTIQCMIRMYCRKHHNTRHEFCPECAELLEYARARLGKCLFQEGKTTCAKCPVHCYKPAMREQARAVMRFAGPRMIYHHPILTFWHYIDGRREEPIKKD